MTVQRTITDATGAHRFSAVPPGDYSLTFALKGFATVVRDGINVGLGFTASVNVELQPGGVTDSVIVSGAPLIDLASTEVAVHFDSEKLASLPGARDIFAVLSLRLAWRWRRWTWEGTARSLCRSTRPTACGRLPA